MGELGALPILVIPGHADFWTVGKGLLCVCVCGGGPSPHPAPAAGALEI